MKLIIELQDDLYKTIKNTQYFISGRRSGHRLEGTIFNALRNGIVINEDIISRQDALKVLEQYQISVESGDADYMAAVDSMVALPTIDKEREQCENHN